MNKIISWLLSPGGAGWVFGIISLLILIITRKRDLRPRRVVVQELRRVVPISIRENIKDRIKMTFDDRKVESLGQIEASIFNEGKDTITEPEIRIEFAKNIKVIDATVPESNNGIAEWAENVVKVKFKFLNARKEHKHAEKVSIITEGRIDGIRVTGGGEGWSVRHIPLPTALEQKKYLRRVLWSFLILVIFYIAYVWFWSNYFNIPWSEISLRAFVTSSPAFVMLIAWAVFAVLQFKKMR